MEITTIGLYLAKNVFHVVGYNRAVKTTILFIMTLLASCMHSNDGGETTPRQIHTMEPNAYCEEPALLEGRYPPDASGYIILFSDEVNVDNEVNRLTNIFSIEVGAIYDSIEGFYALMDDDIMQQIRCDSSIKSVHYNDLVTFQ